MHRVDTDGHVANLFSGGDPTIPRAPTQVDAAILNAFQEELANLITGYGVALVKGTNTQVRSLFNPDLTNSKLLEAVASFVSTGAGGPSRVHVKVGASNSSELWITLNAKFRASDSKWVKDNDGGPAIAIMLSSTSVDPWDTAIQLLRQDGVGPFAESAWIHPQVFKALNYPAPANGWGDYGGSGAPGVCSRGPDRVVHVEGVAKLSGAGVVTDNIATLPVGLRRSAAMRFPAVFDDAGTLKFCNILMASNGVLSTNASSGSQLSFAFSFVADS